TQMTQTAADANASPATYLTDDLFRTATAAEGVSDQDRAEAERIIAKGVAAGQLADDDRVYLSGLITDRTGVSAADADARITNALMQQKEDARNAVKASLAICLSLLLGAFIASAAGALGGMHRDTYYETGKFRV